MNFLQNIDIHTISVLGAPGCNLQCSYCQMAKQIHAEEKTKLWNETIDALKDGTYVDNIIKSLRRLKTPIGQISRIELWGQEPTLTLPYITQEWEYWFTSFYGLERIFFSTNGMGDPNNIFDFIKKADEIYAKYEKNRVTRELKIEVQLSYDGKYGEDVVRGGSSALLRDNFLTLFKMINNYTFKSKLKFEFYLHSVISADLVKYLNTITKVEDYFREYERFYLDLKESSNNDRVFWHSPAFMYQNCYNATTQDGLELANFVKCANYVKNTKIVPEVLTQSAFDDFVLVLLGNSGYGTIELMRQGNYQDFNEYIDNYFVNPNHLQRLNLDTCSTSIADLKILYDGQVVMCQNSIYDTRIDVNLLDDSVDNWGRYHFMNHGQTINLITSSDEEIEKYYTYILSLRKPENFIFTYAATTNLMLLMAQNGQINPIYIYDKQKLKRHAYLLARICWCYYNTQVMSGSVFIRASGEIRQLCNGVLDILDDYIQSDMSKRRD